MTDWERMQERIFVFADADKRLTLNEQELGACPTCEEILDLIGKE